MRFIDRVRNLWALSEYRVDGEFIVPGLQGQVPKLIRGSKPARKLAKIVETKDTNLLDS